MENTMGIMENGEVVEMTEQAVTKASGKGLKVAAGVGLTVLVGAAAWRFLIKPMAAKLKAKKEVQIAGSENTAEPVEETKVEPEEI